jgi:hypothetical protein
MTTETEGFVDLEVIDDALSHVTAIEDVLRVAREGHNHHAHRSHLGRRFHAIAQVCPDRHEFAPVRGLAALAEKVTDSTDGEMFEGPAAVELLQHAADVLSVLLRDRSHQLQGRRAAAVAPAADALRERLEYILRSTVRRR